MNEQQKPFRILVVDDEQSILDEFQRILVTQPETDKTDSKLNELQQKLFGSRNNIKPLTNFDLVLCRQADQAVEIVRTAKENASPFAVAFLDMRMPPGNDGAWTAEQIRNIDPDINIVIVTAYSDVDPREIADRVPPDQKLFYLQKPFHPQEIRQFAIALGANWISEQRLICEKTKLALEESDRLKTQFIVTISHELRTPLVVLKNVISNAAAGILGKISPKLRENLDIADQSIDRLANLVRDFLDVAEMQAGKFRLNPAPNAVRSVIAQAVELLTPQITAKNIDLQLVLPQQEFLCNIDVPQLTRVLINLIGNAVKFVPEKVGKITIRLTDLGNELRIVIEDNGPGIDQHDIDRLFSRFVQLQRQVGPGRHGTGLGLTIAKTIVELHGGRIWVQSTPGKGTSFYFTLPNYQPAEQLTSAFATQTAPEQFLS